jgi:hypothetical protein
MRRGAASAAPGTVSWFHAVRDVNPDMERHVDADGSRARTAPVWREGGRGQPHKQAKKSGRLRGGQNGHAPAQSSGSVSFTPRSRRPLKCASSEGCSVSVKTASAGDKKTRAAHKSTRQRRGEACHARARQAHRS